MAAHAKAEIRSSGVHLLQLGSLWQLWSVQLRGCQNGFAWTVCIASAGGPKVQHQQQRSGKFEFKKMKSPTGS
jgi:hypothetical protein